MRPNHAEARYRLVCVQAYVILDVFSVSFFNKPGVICLPVLSGLPEDAEVCDVQYDFMSRRFQFLVWHRTFDIVPDGENIPRWPAFVEMRECKLAKNDGSDIPVCVTAPVHNGDKVHIDPKSLEPCPYVHLEGQGHCVLCGWQESNVATVADVPVKDASDIPVYVTEPTS